VAVRLRLTRKGKKKQPTYRIVAADSRSPRDGRFIEIVGFYDPRPDPSVIRVDNEKALRWLKNGAQPSERVKKLLVISGAWHEFTGEAPAVTVTPAAQAPSESEAQAEVAPAEVASEETASAKDAPAEVPTEAVHEEAAQAENSESEAEAVVTPAVVTTAEEPAKSEPEVEEIKS